MLKKVLVTGHTKGGGLAACELLKTKAFEVIGISRANGFDLVQDYEKVRDFILNQECDIFVNNAYAPINQTRLLREVYEEWEKKDKLIINVCSVAALVPSGHPDHNMPYVLDKREQKKYCDNKNFYYSKKDFAHVRCGLVNLNFDYVKTSFKSKHDKRLYPNLNPSEVAGIILYTIEGFLKDICFREISFHSTRKPEVTL